MHTLLTRNGPRAACLALLISGLAQAQVSPFDELRSYDYQSRQPVHRILGMIQQAGKDAASVQRIERELVAVLNHPETSIAGKQEAARFLWMVGGREAVPALAALIGEAALTDIAVYGLERNPSSEAAAALRQAVGRTSGQPRVGIINAIGARRDRGAVGLLRNLLRSSDPASAEAATAALGKIGTTAAVSALKSLPASNAGAGTALVQAAKQLAGDGLKAEAAALLRSLVEGSRPSVVRAAALETLLHINPSQGALLALKAMESRDVHVAAVAASQVGHLRSTTVTASATAKWPRLSSAVQAVLLEAWAERGELRAGNVALEALKSKDALVRIRAIRAAGRCAGSRAVGRLVELGRMGEGEEREAAFQALVTMRSAEAEGPLKEMAGRGETSQRVVVMRVLGMRNTAGSLDTLLRCAGDKDVQVASAALQAVRNRAGESEYSALVALVSRAEDEGVQDAGRETLVAVARRMPNAHQAAAPLVTALGQALPGRPALLQALAEIGGAAAIEALVRFAGDNSLSSELKQAALQALAERATDMSALSALLSLAAQSGDRSARIQATRGYIRIVGAAEGVQADSRVAALRDVLAIVERDEERRQVLGVLRECRVPQAVDLAATMLASAELREDAEATILFLASPDRERPNQRPGVKGDQVIAALRKIAESTTNAEHSARARALLGGGA